MYEEELDTCSAVQLKGGGGAIISGPWVMISSGGQGNWNAEQEHEVFLIQKGPEGSDEQLRNQALQSIKLSMTHRVNERQMNEACSWRMVLIQLSKTYNDKINDK